MMLVRAVAAALAVALFSHASALEECAGGDVHTASKQLQNPGRQSVLFNNQHQKTVQLFWVNSAGSEVYMDEIASGMQRSFSTYEGHAWRIKSYAGTPGDASYTIMDVMVPEPLEPAEDGSVSMHEFVVPRCGTASQGSLPVKTLPASDLASVLADRFPKCTALDSLGQDAVPGFHVVCSNGATGEVAVARSKTDEFVVFTVPEKVRASPVALRTAIERTLELPDPWIRTFMGRKLSASYHRPFWTLFTTDGLYKMTQWEHMVENEINPSGTAYLFEGGVFIWPGVEIGHKFAVKSVQGRSGNVTLETMSLIPLVFSITGLFDEAECDHIIKIAEPYIAPSVVNKMDNDIGKPDTEWRTSKTHFINRGQDEIVKDLERRVRDVTNIPISNGEGAQILKYEKGQHYHTHHDYFEPTQYSKSARTLEMTEYGASNRLATVFWYLSTVPEGGETNFPRAGGAPRPTRSDKCYTGLKVKPVKGRVMIFYDMLPNGHMDEYSLHAGCDVECEGCVKWSANKWLWNKDQGGRGWTGDEDDRRKDSHAWPTEQEIAAMRSSGQLPGSDKDEL